MRPTRPSAPCRRHCQHLVRVRVRGRGRIRVRGRPRDRVRVRVRARVKAGAGAGVTVGVRVRVRVGDVASTAQVEVALGDLVAGDAELLRLLERLHPLERRLAQHVARRVQQEGVGLQVGGSG